LPGEYVRSTAPSICKGNPRRRGVSIQSERISDAAVFRDNPVAIADFLTRAFDTNDQQLIVAAFARVIRAHNVLAIAEAAGLRREGLYKTFTNKSDPRIGRILKLFAALDVQVVVKALPRKPKTPRPKRGPPFRNKPGAFAVKK